MGLFLYALYLGALGVLLPAVGAAFGLGPAAEARLFPANFGGFIVCVLLCGVLSDRLGRKAVLLAGVAMFALGLTLFGRASGFGAALAATALVGAGTGATETVASALVADLYPERRAFVLNVLQVAFGAGAALSPALAHHALAAGTSWRILYLGLAAANTVLFVALCLPRVPRAVHAHDALDWAGLRALVRQPVFLGLCLAQGLYVGVETGFASWMPTYFLRRLPGGVAWAGLVVTVFWITMTVGRTLTGGVIHRAPLLRLSLLLTLGGTVGSVLALAWTSPLVVLAWVAFTGLFLSGIFGLILAEAGERYPAFAGTAFGAVVAAGGVGGALLPWLVGVLAGTGLDWRGALGLVPFTAVLLAALLRRMERLPVGPGR